MLARHLPFFYGWIIVMTSFLCVFVMGATSFWALPVFVEPMHADTGWSHTTIFLGLSVFFLLSGLGGFVFGRVTDFRGGAQRALLGGLLLESCALFSLRWVESPWQFILIYGGLGGLGGSCIRLVQATLIAKWFVARRGAAVGMASNGGSVSALLMIPLTSLLIRELGWRDAWSVLAVITLAILLPLVPFVVRAPEDIGLQPDGGHVPAPGRRSAASEQSYHLNEVIRRGSFWLLLFGVLVGNFSLQGHTVVMVPYLEDIGYTSAEAALALSMYGFFSLGMRFVWGSLADQRGVRIAITAQSALSALAVLLLFQAGAGMVALYVIIAVQGLMMSGFPPLQIMVWPEFFGRAYIGSIVGIAQPFTTIAGATAPVIVGALFDQTGGYGASLWMLIGSWLLCTAVMLVVKPAQKTTVLVEAKVTGN